MTRIALRSSRKYLTRTNLQCHSTTTTTTVLERATTTVLRTLLIEYQLLQLGVAYVKIGGVVNVPESISRKLVGGCGESLVCETRKLATMQRTSPKAVSVQYCLYTSAFNNQ